MAMQTSMGNVALAIGPFAAGLLLDAVDDNYRPVLIAIAVGNALTLALLILLAKVHRTPLKRLAANLIASRTAPTKARRRHALTAPNAFDKEWTPWHDWTEKLHW